MGQGCLNGTNVVEDEVIGKKDSKNHHGIIFRTINIFKDPSITSVFLPVEEKLVTLRNRTLKVWDTKSFKCVETVKGFGDFVEKWEESAILSCSISSKIKFFDVIKEKPYMVMRIQPFSVEVENIKSVKRVSPGKMVIMNLDEEGKGCDVVTIVSVKDDRIVGTFETKCRDCPSPILSLKSEEMLFSQYQEGDGRKYIGLIDYSKNNNIVNYFDSHVDETSILSLVTYMNAENDEVLVCGGIGPTKSLVYFYNTTIVQNPETQDKNYNLLRKIGIEDEITSLWIVRHNHPKYLTLSDTKGNLHIYEVDTKKRKFKRTFSNNVSTGSIHSFQILPDEIGLMSIVCSENAISFCHLMNLPYNKTRENNVNRKRNANKFFEQGENYYKDGDFESAIRQFTMGIEISPVCEALIRRGFCYYSLKNFQDSSTDFKKALSMSPPDNENVLFNLGNTYFEAKKYEKSLVFFNRVLKINPESEEVIFRRGLIYLSTKQYENAVGDFSRVVDNQNGKEQVCESICYRGIAYLNLEEYERATKDFEEAKKLGHPKADFHLEQVRKEIRKKEMKKEFECVLYIMYPSDVELLYDEREERSIELFKDPHEYFKTAKEKKDKVVIKFEDNGDMFIGGENVIKERISDDGEVMKGVIWNDKGIVCIRYMEDFVDLKHFFMVIDRKVKNFNHKFRSFLSRS